MRRLALLLPLPLVLGGCVSMATSVVTAPFKVVGKTVDVLTTSQAKADRNRGRAIRKEEERARKDAKRREKDARADD